MAPWPLEALGESSCRRLIVSSICFLIICQSGKHQNQPEYCECLITYSVKPLERSTEWSTIQAVQLPSD